MKLQTRLQTAVTRSDTPPSLLVVSDGPVGSLLAAEFDATAEVTLLTDSPAVETQAPENTRVVVGDITARATLGSVADAATTVVALKRDRQALLVTQLLRTQFGSDDIVVLLNDPQRHEAVADLATTVVCGSTCLAGALRDVLEPTLVEPPESHR